MRLAFEPLVRERRGTVRDIHAAGLHYHSRRTGVAEFGRAYAPGLYEARARVRGDRMNAEARK
jgi:hypothetical protein